LRQVLSQKIYRKKNIYTEILWGEVLIEKKLKRNLLLKLTKFKKEASDSSDYPLMKSFFHHREKFFYEHLTLTRKNYEYLISSQFK
jgi:hypothetical protein